MNARIEFMWKTMCVMGILSACAWFLPLQAEADSVTWSFTGEVAGVYNPATHTGSIAVGNTVEGVIEFDLDNAWLLSSTSTYNAYRDAILGLDVNFSSGDYLNYEGGGVDDLLIRDDDPGQHDYYNVLIYGSGGYLPLSLSTSLVFPDEWSPDWQLQLFDADETALSSLDPLSVPPDLSELETARLIWRLQDPQDLADTMVIINFTSLEATPAAAPVPEPATVTLVGLGLSVMALRYRMRRRTQSTAS